MTEDALLRRFSEAPVARLATVDERLRPHLVPITFAVDGRRVFTAVDQKPKRTAALKRIRNIATHAQVSILVDHYEDDWDRLWWVRVDGAAQVLAEGSLAQRALRVLADKYGRYRADPPPGPFVAIEIQRITGWSASA